jgi:hypothetical protein
VIDSTTPAVTILSGPPAIDSSTTGRFTIDPGRSGITLMCKIDGWDWAACPGGPDDGSPREVDFPGLLDATHLLKVRGDGPLSGPGPVVSHSWVIDSTPPTVALSSGPRGRVAAADAAFSFGSTDPSAEFDCRLDEAAFASCSSPLQLAGLADGSHRVEIRARDEIGNLSPVVSRSWTVDTTGPVVDLTGVPASGSPAGKVAIDFASAEADAIFSCRLDGADWRPCASPYEAEVAAGAHRFEVRAADSLGNQGPVAAHDWDAVSAPVAVRPVISLLKRVRAGRQSRVKVADLRCQSSCRLTAPARVKVRFGRQAVRVPLVAPRGSFTGRKAIRIKVTGRLRRALKTRSGQIRLSLRAASAAGKTRATGTVKVSR